VRIFRYVLETIASAHYQAIRSPTVGLFAVIEGIFLAVILLNSFPENPRIRILILVLVFGSQAGFLAWGFILNRRKK